MQAKYSLLMLLVLFLFPVALTSANDSVSTDREALVTLYNSTNGDNWTTNTNWLSDEPLGNWYGITTNADGRVIEIDLRINDLAGTLPTELGNISNLTKIRLEWNSLTGAIPSEIGNLSQLRNLHLQRNNLSGALPSSLGNLSNLQFMSAYDNNLSGDLTVIGNLSSLVILLIHSNEFTGAIPSEIGNLSNLTRLNLNGNQLSGAIPSALGNLTQLEMLHLASNDLTGTIPAELGNLTNLKWLLLNNNELSGCLPLAWQSIEWATRFGLPTHDLDGLNLPYCIPPTPTPTPTLIPTRTAETCQSVVDLYHYPHHYPRYLLFPTNSFLSGTITIYPDSNCEAVEGLQTFVDNNGYAFTTSGQRAAEGLCTVRHNDGLTYTADMLSANNAVWLCELPGTTPVPWPTRIPPTVTPVPPTATTAPTSTPDPVTDRAISNFTLMFNGPGRLLVNWDRPVEAPASYHITWAKVGEEFPSTTASDGNFYPTGTGLPLIIDGLEHGVSYKAKVRAYFADLSYGSWSAPVEALALPSGSAPNTLTPTPTSTVNCINVGPGNYWLFPASNFLSGGLTVYPDDTCADTDTSQTSIGDNGYVYTTAGQAAAESLCAAGHNDGSTFSVVQQVFNTDVWQCTLPATDTPVPSATNTPVPTATSTPIPPTDTPVPTATIATAPGKPTNLSALIASNGIWLSWTAPSDDIDGYQILRRRPRMGEDQLLIHVENTGNNNTSYLDTDVSGDDEKYVYRIKAIRAGMLSNRSKFVDVYVIPGQFLVVPPSNTPVPTDTPVPPTNTPVPTNTPLPPTNTPVPTDTPVPPTSTPIPPTNTPVPTDSKAISNVTLTSNQAGVLELSWDAPSQTPDDYRIAWAKVGENFKTVSDSSGNAFPTSPSYTITGLDEGVRYQVKVRARYRGESNGDWTAEYQADVASS